MEELEAPPTYTETFSQNFQLIYADLQLTIPQEIEMYPSPYSETMPLEMKFSLANRMLQRAKRMNNRVLMLTNAFYLGKLIEEIEDPTVRSVYVKKLTKHYYRASVRIYYLFEFLGPAQIARSKKTTLKLIVGLSTVEYNDLIDKATEIYAGTQNLEGE
jgi:hypothetical protein